MRVGEYDYLYAEVCPTDAVNKLIRWSSTNTSIVWVNEATGRVEARGVGRATIYATAQDGTGVRGSCTVQVEPPIPVQGIDICCDNYTMNVGDITYLSYDIYPSDATNKNVVWGSSHSHIVSVDTTGKVTAYSPGTTTITATTVDGSYKDLIEIKVVIDNVTIKSDGVYNKVIFESTGKEWYCINHDLIFDENYMNDNSLRTRSNKNIYLDETGNTKNFKTYSDNEIKLLYAIDPHGVSHFVQTTAGEEDTLEDIVQYKDRYFQLLFRREPKYFARTLDGVWYEVTEYDEINDVLSESETIFGMHPIYDARTWIELLQFASTIIEIALDTTFIGKMLSAGINIITTVQVVSLATDFNTVKNELSGYVSDTVTGDLIEEHFKDTIIDWASDYVSLYDSLQDLSDAMTLDLSYSKEVINYCACDTGYNVLFEMKNGMTYRLHDVCDLINQ